MAHSTDKPGEKSDPEKSLPQPELNPLLNPLLGDNMGRWAEVYFTSAPEKREEAVSALIEQLEQEKQGKKDPPTTARVPDVSSYAAEQETEKMREDSATGESGLICQSCGEINPDRQNYCGMCGASLHTALTQPHSRVYDADLPPWPGSGGRATSSLGSSSESSDYSDRTKTSQDWITESRESGYRNLRPQEMEIGEELPTLFSEYRPSPYRYRIYIGLVLLVLVGALGYMGWRGTQSKAGRIHLLPVAPTAASEPEAAPPAQESQPASQEAKPSEDVSSARSATTPPQSATSASNAGSSANPNPASAKAATTSTGAVGSGSSDKSSPTNVIDASASKTPEAKAQGNGSEELAVAEGFLNGSQGRVRDSNEAAKWLWQAVRKQNPTATLLLSDLYLHGDGVPKNCDQARLLLDVAARKGAPGAEQRLRNLQAFGCQ